MELSAVGERVFAAESIIKRRIRKVGGRPASGVGGRPPNSPSLPQLLAAGSWPRRWPARRTPALLPHTALLCVLQGRIEYLVKWKGWAIK